MAEFYKLCEEVGRFCGEHVSDIEFYDLVSWIARERGIPTP
ncbi:hypothetical protein [Agromyces sp. CCNWLW203]